jgi:hypothetical protein
MRILLDKIAPELRPDFRGIIADIKGLSVKKHTGMAKSAAAGYIRFTASPAVESPPERLFNTPGCIPCFPWENRTMPGRSGDKKPRRQDTRKGN